MSLSEDRVSNMAHEVINCIWRDDLADVIDESRALARVKQSLGAFFGAVEEIDGTVRAKLRNHAQGSRDWELLYQKFYQEELAKRHL
ncbi:DUF507 family protein [Oryzomonas sagensis]|uniref:DUF507 family protein n=1 Tax=Oryzomonas sagensis TaxID=2603857 RepID=A0ABQ6TPD2_9BACT|nr:DUF507 family protein [Oryzomonas sagensis]KAB0670513.1 DUF507 family protein [Oryzomonas sagensis]